MNPCDLEAGADLDYWTGRAMQLDVFKERHPRDPHGLCWQTVDNRVPVLAYDPYRPSTNKAQAFEVLETFSNFSGNGLHLAAFDFPRRIGLEDAIHESLLVRICRCKVLLVFGNELPIEKE